MYINIPYIMYTDRESRERVFSFSLSPPVEHFSFDLLFIVPSVDNSLSLLYYFSFPFSMLVLGNVKYSLCQSQIPFSLGKVKCFFIFIFGLYIFVGSKGSELERVINDDSDCQVCFGVDFSFPIFNFR